MQRKQQGRTPEGTETAADKRKATRRHGKRLVPILVAFVFVIVFMGALAFYTVEVQHSTAPPVPGTVVLDTSGVLVYDTEWHPNLQAGAKYNFSFLLTSGPGYWVEVGPDPSGIPRLLPRTHITTNATSLVWSYTIQASGTYWIELSNLGDEFNHSEYQVTVMVV